MNSLFARNKNQHVIPNRLFKNNAGLDFERGPVLRLHGRLRCSNASLEAEQEKQEESRSERKNRVKKKIADFRTRAPKRTSTVAACVRASVESRN